MSNYFKYFRNVDYLFGTEQDTAVFQDVTLMSTVIDQVADASTVYQEYYILPNERPDQVSQKLYNRPDYHWTFFLMNPTLRERGWPRSNAKLFEAAELKYPRKVITTRTKLTDKFKVGQTLTGQTSEATATILERNLDLGQLFLNDGVSGTFLAGENVNSTNSDGVIEVIVVQSFADQYNVAHHYENSSGEIVDIDPEVGPGAQLTEVTYLNRLERLNDADNEIKVIRPDFVNEIVRSFRETLSVR